MRLELPDKFLIEKLKNGQIYVFKRTFSFGERFGLFCVLGKYIKEQGECTKNKVLIEYTLGAVAYYG
jgi:hypothetical protein